MVRSAAAILAVLILPSFTSAQQAQGTHTVVLDDTLWDLAQRYYQDPWDWRVIWEANRAQVQDPNLIYPDQVLVIPGLPGNAGTETVAQATPGQPAAQPAMPAEPMAPPPMMPGGREARPAGETRTVFFSDPSAAGTGVVGMEDVQRLAVPRDLSYSAPWLQPFGTETRHDGTIVGFADPAERGSTIRSFHDARLDMTAATRVGAQLQVFRVERDIEMVGQVVVPTGVITVTAVTPEGAVGTVTKEYGRIQPGDMVRPLPNYPLALGQKAQPVSGGSEAMIMGFAGTATLNDIGQLAFLDLGANDGITIGDEFVLFSETRADDPRGSLQVVAVTDRAATARIMSMDDDVFDRGVVVRLSKKMR